MKHLVKRLVATLFIVSAGVATRAHTPTPVDLSGSWNVALDSLDCGESEHWFDAATFPDVISLPGTTDAVGLGTPCTLMPALTKPQLSRLARNHRYIGAAWYTRSVQIPASMAGQPLRLSLERVMWRCDVWIDGRRLEGSGESLTTPHTFDVPDGLTAGEHRLTLRIDNRKQYDISVDELAHAYTDDTQIKWNGVLGSMLLSVIPDIEFADVAVYPDVADKSVRIAATIINHRNSKVKEHLSLLLDNETAETVSIKIPTGKSSVEMIHRFDGEPRLWSASHPSLYTLQLSLSQSRSVSEEVTFGMREISNVGGTLSINGHRIFLRGTLECCIHPLTGTPPTTRQGWLKVFATAREWGLNHLRFHSWCPPEAAFAVADSMGFYLQVELPVWSVTLGNDPAVKEFMSSEFERIVKTYGNHPSLCMLSAGNELQYDFEWLNELVAHMRTRDPRHLYTTTSYTFENGHGGLPEPQDQFFVTQCTDDGWVRGQGLFDDVPPRFDTDYDFSLRRVTVPLVAHEIGQYAVYPDMREITKYTGTLTPLNLKSIYNDLEQKGLLARAGDYTAATGRFAALLYKEEIERALKTRLFGGFQLLGLQDFPGQGTATVGLVDAFWDSKGVVEPEQFREFCADVVPLARFAKAVYTATEPFEASFEIANYSEATLTDRTLSWQLSDNEHCYASGRLSCDAIISGGLTPAGRITVPLDNVPDSRQLTLRLAIDDTDWHNSWSIWVYPGTTVVEPANVAIVRDTDTAMSLLSQGHAVLLCPQTDSINGIESKFVPVFWSPVHFPEQAGGMGILCNPAHPALSQFPTAMHSDWQWWHPVKNARTMILDAIPHIRPFIEVIDNFANNRRLGLAFEARCNGGRLMVCSINFMHDDPATRQLYSSLLNYMGSEMFNPAVDITPEVLKDVLCTQQR